MSACAAAVNRAIRIIPSIVSGGLKMHQNWRYENVHIKKGDIASIERRYPDLSGFNLILHSIAFAFDEDSFGMMQEAIKQG